MVLVSTKLPVQLVPGTLSAGGKVFSGEVKNEWSHTYTPHILSWRAHGRITERPS